MSRFTILWLLVMVVATPAGWCQPAPARPTTSPAPAPHPPSTPPPSAPAPAPVPATAPEVPRAPVVLENTPLFFLTRSLRSLPLEQRARLVNERLLKAARDGRLRPQEFRVTPGEFGPESGARDFPIVVVKARTPFVLQTALNDFYVTYELNARTDRPRLMPEIYSDLHRNIQDRFNEAGVEIMSPHYTQLREGNPTTIPESYLSKGYTPPAHRVQPLPPPRHPEG